MTKRIRLRAVYTGAGGGVNYPGEMIGVDERTAERLVRSGAAQYVEQASPPAKDVRQTKPARDPGKMNGLAKLHWCRDEIRRLGAEPRGRTLVELQEQLQELS